MNEQDTQKGKYVTFKSGNEYFGLKIQYVNEIIVFQEITEIPETEDYIKGLINLRGKIIPVIDVRLRFKQEPFEYGDRTCIIVINVKSTVVGLIVEQIAEVVEIPEESILPSPTMGHSDKTQNKYVYGIGKVGEAVKLLLDPDKLINDSDLNLTDEFVAGEEEETAQEEQAEEKEAAKAEQKAEAKKEKEKKKDGKKETKDDSKKNGNEEKFAAKETNNDNVSSGAEKENSDKNEKVQIRI